ncbi:MAG: N-acetylmuramoyl-L-alanine amidase [Elusimicrobiaceae bacterium]|nr:N-acetylmuramoyl-L-alanine amidase [Elusimicrobiaceae bacterium]
MKRIPFLLISILFSGFPLYAQSIEVAPYLPAQEKTAPADAPITVQYPYEKMTVTRGAKNIFIFGKINLPEPITLTINGSSVPVYNRGTFVSFLPVQSGEFEFLLTATSQGRIYQATRHIIVPGADIKDFSQKAKFDEEEIFPQHPVEVLPGDTLDLYARGTPHGQVTATLSGIKDGKNIPLKEDAVSPGIYRAQYVIAPEQKAKTVKITYRLKEGPNDSSSKSTAPAKIKILSEKESARPALITAPGVKLRKIPTARENLYPFYRAYGYVEISGRLNNQYRLSLGENETAWLEMEKIKLLDNPPTPNRIHTLTQTAWPDKTRFVFAGAQAVPIQIHEFNNRLELTLYYTEGFDENFSLDETSPLVENITWSVPAPRTLSFKIYFKPNATPWGHAYNFEEDNLVLDLMHKPELTPTKDKPLAGARILLDAGHSPQRKVPYDGAIGPGGYLEYEATIALAEDLKPLLEAKGATVILTRHGNNHMSLQDRYQLALKEQAHIFISLHYNALPETVNPMARARGYSVYYNYPHSFALAQAVYKSFTRQVPLPDNGMIANDILFIPRIPHLPSILVENAYLILPQQEEMARDKEKRQVFVQALYEGILDFYGVPLPPAKKTAVSKRKPFKKPAKQLYLRPAPAPVLSPLKK